MKHDIEIQPGQLWIEKEELEPGIMGKLVIISEAQSNFGIVPRPGIKLWLLLATDEPALGTGVTTLASSYIANYYKKVAGH